MILVVCIIDGLFVWDRTRRLGVEVKRGLPVHPGILRQRGALFSLRILLGILIPASALLWGWGELALLGLSMNLLLDRWGCQSVMLAETQAQAAQQVLMHGSPDFVLVDYHLNDQSNGLRVMEHLDDILGTKLPAIVITADRSGELEEAVREKGYGLLRKPIRPAALRALMTNILKTKL